MRHEGIFGKRACRETRLGLEGHRRHLNTMVSVGRELSLMNGQPDHTLQCPELPGEPILGSRVQKTVLLKIQNIRVFIQLVNLKKGKEATQNQPCKPRRGSRELAASSSSQVRQ